MQAALIHNPVSGKPAQHDALRAAIEAFRRAGWQVDVHQTAYKGHARDLAEQAARAGKRRIIVAGGDGSVGQAAEGILRAGEHDAVLGVIPMGTGNVFARDLGLPYPLHRGYLAVAQAAQIVLHGEAVPLDVGVANGHTFLCWAGCGIDAMVTEQVETKFTFDKRLLPLPTYVYALIRTLRNYRPQAMRVILDGGEALEGRYFLAAACNIALYARYIKVAPAAHLDDGLLDLVIIEEPNALRFVYTALRLLFLPHAETPSVRRRQFRSLHLETDQPQPVHLDGDPVGMAPLHIGVMPRRLPVLLDRRRASHRLV